MASAGHHREAGSSTGRVVIAAAVVVFLAAATWAGTRLFAGEAAPYGAGGNGAGSVVATGTPGATPVGSGGADVARAFLAAWAAGKFDRMQELVADPADDMRHVYGGLAERLHLTRVSVTPGAVDPVTGALAYSATLTVAGHHWTYSGSVPVTHTADGWRVAFTSATVHPDLRTGQVLMLAAPDVPPSPPDLLDRAGHELAVDADLAANLLGQEGVGGLRRVVGDRPGADAAAPNTLVIANAVTGETVETLATWARPAGKGLRTTISLPVQRAAERAVAAVPGTAAIVALDTRTGEVRAIANKPTSGVPPALTPYAPGSTFKIVTAAAALANGTTPSTPVDCPRTVTIHGRTLHNHEQAQLGRVSLTTAFAQSCNTAFATLGAGLPAGALARAAATFGFGTGNLLPIASPAGSLPPPASPAQAVEDTIGQGSVTASPLAMAAVAAAVADGTWRQPHVLACPACRTHPVPQAGPLRTLMRAVVTGGTGTRAAARGGPVYGKTGTAEYGAAADATHAWFVGWQGTLAFAVFAHDGSSGGAVAAPAAARFLTALA